MTREAAFQQAAELIRNGYEVLPCDHPEKALQGFIAFRINPQERAEGEEDILLEWPMFDKPLTPDDQTIDASAFFALTQETGWARCDDPKRLLLGVVKYHPETGQAMVRRLRLSQAKSLGSENLALLERWRQSLPNAYDGLLTELLQLRRSVLPEQRL